MKKHKLILLIIFVMACSLAIFTGCSLSDSLVPEDYQSAGYRRVYFYYNGGLESGSQSVEYYVKVVKGSDPSVIKGGRLPAPGADGDIKNPVQSGYQFYGWYQVKSEMLKQREELIYNEDGSKVLDTRGNHAARIIPYIEGHDFLNAEKDEEPLTLKDFEADTEKRIFIKEWNFAYDVVTEDVCIMALWAPVRKFVVIPPENKIDNVNAEGYDKLPFYDIDATGGIQLSLSMYHPEKPGNQIEGFYSNAALTSRINIAERYYPEVAYLDAEQTKFAVTPIYIKWLSDKWKIVENASELSVITEKGNYYIRKDLDFTGVSISTPDIYSGEIQGNGYVWRNIRTLINQSMPRIPTDNIFGGLFKNLVGARIRDIKIENLSIEIKRIDPRSVTDVNLWTMPLVVGAFAKDINSATILKDITIVNATRRVNEFTTESDGLGTRYEPVMVDGQPVKLDQFDKPIYPGTNGYEEDEVEYRTTGDGVPYLVEHARDYKGDLRYDMQRVVDEADGRTLFGYDMIFAPGAAADVTWKQFENNFGEAGTNVTGCTISFTDVETSVDWRVKYTGGERPRTPALVAGYEFAGWYTEDYQIWNFTEAPPSSDFILIALWKRI